MKILYECDYCDAQFPNEAMCRCHEADHLSDMDKFKYYLKYIVHGDICSYCAHAYYVYGCELNCEHRGCCDTNNYKDFTPVRTLKVKTKEGDSL